MKRERSTLSKSDYDKAAAFILKIGARAIEMEIWPGRALVKLAYGNDPALHEIYLDEETERAKENWSEYSAKPKPGIGQRRKKLLPAEAPKPARPKHQLRPPPAFRADPKRAKEIAAEAKTAVEYRIWMGQPVAHNRVTKVTIYVPSWFDDWSPCDATALIEGTVKTPEEMTELFGQLPPLPDLNFMQLGVTAR